MNREGCHEHWLKSFLYSICFGITISAKKEKDRFKHPASAR